MHLKPFNTEAKNTMQAFSIFITFGVAFGAMVINYFRASQKTAYLLSNEEQAQGLERKLGIFKGVLSVFVWASIAGYAIYAVYKAARFAQKHKDGVKKKCAKVCRCCRRCCPVGAAAAADTSRGGRSVATAPPRQQQEEKEKTRREGGAQSKKAAATDGVELSVISRTNSVELGAQVPEPRAREEKQEQAASWENNSTTNPMMMAGI